MAKGGGEGEAYSSRSSGQKDLIELVLTVRGKRGSGGVGGGGATQGGWCNCIIIRQHMRP